MTGRLHLKAKNPQSAMSGMGVTRVHDRVMNKYYLSSSKKSLRPSRQGRISWNPLVRIARCSMTE